jgi:hypothetical protein
VCDNDPRAHPPLSSVPIADNTAILAELGRRLASHRETLIAQGVDPRRLLTPIHPADLTAKPSDR